ncbi:hypothetical protein OGATHE_003099 [Ogataea polymorpha]|uniref:Uncharacterized protein n=1 Tax=Ogataea polymorpha TaxID=460523 RepID=A0A9P8T692_9ASCO|nr:hypothetical protein OGATHE_003099 [Ogataea polymorpha]
MPFSMPARIIDDVHTISVSLTVKSSSFDVLVSVITTDGRIHTGGAGRYRHRYISGRPPLDGSIPSSSQSLVSTCLNKFSTFRGLRSSKHRLKNFSRSGFSSNRSSKSSSHCNFSSAPFLPTHLNVSWMILSAAGPAPAAAFLTTPFNAPHRRHRRCFLAWSSSFLRIFMRRRLSRPGRLRSFKNCRLLASSSSTAEQVLQIV